MCELSDTVRVSALGLRRAQRASHAVLRREFENRPARPGSPLILGFKGVTLTAPFELRNCMSLMNLQAWLAALDDFRNWLIREAA
jgi:hypothetical protein